MLQAVAYLGGRPLCDAPPLGVEKKNFVQRMGRNEAMPPPPGGGKETFGVGDVKYGRCMVMITVER